MKQTLQRYWRAFRLAFEMTRRRQKPPALAHPELLAWIRQMDTLIEAARASGDRGGFDRARREALRVRLDGRDTSVEAALAVLHYHARQEYPSLLRSGAQHNLLAIQSSNFNDRYRLSRLLELPELADSPFKTALAGLLAHLERIPSS
ncbi:MAG: hypothetical protein HXY41_17045 [Chloroflexi bacterium]|nr:hypothetical protein [Chloroflexota bacterium]